MCIRDRIYTDSKAGDKIKSAAQGLITLATYGVGMLVGFYVSGKIAGANVIEDGHDWNAVWVFPAIFAAAVFLIFAVLFKNEKIEYTE